MKVVQSLTIYLFFALFTLFGCTNSSIQPVFDHTWKLEKQSLVTAPTLKSSLNNRGTRGIQFLSDKQLLVIGRPTFVANFIYRNDSLYYQPEHSPRIQAFKTRLSSKGDTLIIKNEHETRIYSKLTPPETNYDLTTVKLSGFQYYSKTTPSFSFSLTKDGTADVDRLVVRSSISDDPPIKLPPKEFTLDSTLVKGLFTLGDNISIPMETFPQMRKELLIVGDQNMTLSYSDIAEQSINFNTIKDPYWLLLHRSLMSLLIEERLQHEVFDGNPFF